MPLLADAALRIGSSDASVAYLGAAQVWTSTPSTPRVKVGDGRLVLTWPKVRGATGYTVSRDGTEVGTTTGDVTFYVDTDVDNDTAYTYSVVTADAATVGEAEPATPTAATADTTFARHRGYLANDVGDLELIDPDDFDVIICNPAYHTDLATLQAAHPDTKFLLYQNAAASALDGTDDHLAVGTLWSTAHEPWFLHNDSGRMTFADFSHRPWMDVGNHGYQQAWLTQVVARVTRDGWDGVFIDDINATMSGGHLGSQDRPDAYPDDATWRKAQRDFNHYVAWGLRDAGILHAANCAYSFSPALGWHAVSADILADWDIAWMEYWVRPEKITGEDLYLTTDIQYQIDRAEWAQSFLTGHAPNDYLSTSDDAALRYHRAIYYASVDLTLPSFSMVGPIDNGTDVVGTPEDLGTPTAARSTPNGTYTYARTMSEGTAYANATADAVTLGGESVASADGLLAPPATPVAVASVRLPGSASRVSTPDSADFTTTDVDVRGRFAPTAWPPTANVPIASQCGGPPNRKWTLFVTTAPKLSLGISTTGSNITFKNSSVNISATAGVMYAWRLTIDSNNGSSQYAVAFYTRTDDDITSNTGWTQIGSTVNTSGAFTLPDSATALELGGDENGDGAFDADYEQMALMDSIGGTVLAHFDAREVTKTGTRTPTTYTDPQGRVWTASGTDWDWNA